MKSENILITGVTADAGFAEAEVALFTPTHSVLGGGAFFLHLKIGYERKINGLVVESFSH